MVIWLPVAVAAIAAAALAWAVFEAQWVEFREVEVPLAGLPPSLDGLRIIHLSDFHLGKLSLNGVAVRRAVEWAAGREADLVAVTGDLLTRRSGRPALRRALGRLRERHPVYAVLGNHDIGESRDPFVEGAHAGELGAVLLACSAASLNVRGARVQIAGVDPGTYARGAARLGELADPEAALRLLLCHFPGVVDRIDPGAYHLVLAGHMHGGQICIPYPGGKLRLEHLRARYWEGLYRCRAASLYVSRGLGTSFVPFRFFARPEATELTLHSLD